MASILLLEDYPSLQRIFSTILKSAGHSVRVASNGQEGLNIADKQEFDIILVDILMPIMNGVDFLREYKLSDHPNVKAIALTNIYDEDTVKQVKKLGASDYVVKADIKPADLIDVVNKHLA